MGLFDSKNENKCVNDDCSRELPAGSNFCPYCGTAQPAGKQFCPNCDALVAADANFCPHCRHQLREPEAGPTIEGRRWAKSPDDFAVRVEVDDVPGLFRKDLVVEPGTRALLLEDGKNMAGELGPGKYTLQSAGLTSAKTATAILVDSGDTDLEFTIPDLFTTDPMRITVDCRLVAGVDNAVMFLTNLMKGERIFSLGRLRQYLFDEIQNAASEAVGRHSVQELSSNLALKEELATDIEAHLNRTFRRMGLRFDRVRALNFRHERWDEVREAQEDLFLQISAEDAVAEGRKRLADALHEKELQEIAEETREVERYEKRAQTWARMRRAVNSDRMDEVQTEEDFASFMREIDKQRVIEENELEELQREFAERKEDHTLARAHLLAKAELEREYELKMAELTQQRDLSREQLEFEQEQARMRLEGELAIEEKRQAFELRRQREEAAFRREQAATDRQERLDEALTDAEIEDLERQQDEKDLEMGLRALREMKATRREDEEARMRMQWDDDRRRLEAELAAEERRLKMELKQRREDHAHELNRLEAMAQMSTEALIAASGAEQGRLLVELQKTESLKGMSEEQILALAAENSPEVAKAFQEKFRAMPAEFQQQLQAQMKETYEARIADKDAAAERQERQQEEIAQKLQEMFNKALEEQRKTAEALAQGKGESDSPTVIFGPGGEPAVMGAGATTTKSEGGERVAVCRNCGEESPVGTRYCQNCGEAFYADRSP